MTTSLNGNIFRLTGLCEGKPSVSGGTPSKGQRGGALMFSLISVRTNGWANNQNTGDLGRHRAPYDVTVMVQPPPMNMVKPFVLIQQSINAINPFKINLRNTWWRHQMETFSALLAICAGNSPVPGEFPAQKPVTRSFDVFFDLRLNKRLSKQWWGWRFETLSSPLWRHSNVTETHTSSH